MISKLMKKKNQKGFTLMEMLIVVAIIAVLVAIMIPTVTNQLEKARQTADLANIRAAYAEAMVNSLTSADGEGAADEFKLTKTDGDFAKITSGVPDYLQGGASSGWTDVAAATAGKTVTVKIDADGEVTYTVS